jgi:hypothetical protein
MTVFTNKYYIEEHVKRVHKKENHKDHGVPCRDARSVIAMSVSGRHRRQKDIPGMHTRKTEFHAPTQMQGYYYGSLW